MTRRFMVRRTRASLRITPPARRAPAGGTGIPAPRSGSGGTARSRRARRGRAAAAARPATMPPIVAAGPLVIITMRSDKQHRLVDVVRHHQHGAAGRCDDLHELVLQALRASARRARRTARRAAAPSACIASARAMPTRCFMPPEISCGNLCSRVREADQRQAPRACGASDRPSSRSRRTRARRRGGRCRST